MIESGTSFRGCLSYQARAAAQDGAISAGVSTTCSQQKDHHPAGASSILECTAPSPEHGQSTPQFFMQGSADLQHASLVALFTFVARDPATLKSMEINSLIPSTDAEKSWFEEREALAQSRRAARKASKQSSGIKLPLHVSHNQAGCSETHLMAADAQTSCRNMVSRSVKGWEIPCCLSIFLVILLGHQLRCWRSPSIGMCCAALTVTVADML